MKTARQEPAGKPLPDDVRRVLADAADQFGTPSYVYFIDRVLARFEMLTEVFGGRFAISYAVKSNPNEYLLRAISETATLLDCSSIGEVERGLAAGYSPERLTFSGPAKRIPELRRAVEIGIGEMVCEGIEEIEQLDRLAAEAGRSMSIAIRINPNRIPANFGVNMAGKPTQFGIDEDDMDAALARVVVLKNVRLEGFHIYSGTNCMSPKAIAENYSIFTELFARFSEAANIRPKRLIFGSGIGVPYTPDVQPLDIDEVAALANPVIDRMKENERLAGAQCILELGRFLVSPCGFMLTSVVRLKRSRDVEIALCDAGFNNHLSACGMMGQIIRRNWAIRKITDSTDSPEVSYLLTGPLCTTIDQIAQKIALPELTVGDVLAIEQSGAYGPTASPSAFISHPMPREIVVRETGGEPASVALSDATPSSYETPGRNGNR